MSLSRKKIYDRYKRIFDPIYSISLCREDEIDDVVEFIDTYWKKGHAIVASKELLDWQYYNLNDHTYNFIIARSKETGDIHAIEGFIPTSQFDSNIIDPMTWGSIWKTIPDVTPLGLGLVVKLFREINFDTKYHCEVGVSADAQKYNEQFGNTVYKLDNWYIVNPDCKKYELVEVESVDYWTQSVDACEVELVFLNKESWDEAINGIKIPEYKSVDYYINRYFNHPIYMYHAALLRNIKNGEKEILIFRIPKHGENSCIFIVDYIGTGVVLSKAAYILSNLLKEYGAEYILFPCSGINDSFLKNAGFKNLRETSDVIPMYYEPFIKKNVEIICASRYNDIDWCSFKGDSDQDRPSLINI